MSEVLIKPIDISINDQSLFDASVFVSFTGCWKINIAKMIRFFKKVKYYTGFSHDFKFTTKYYKKAKYK